MKTQEYSGIVRRINSRRPSTMATVVLRKRGRKGKLAEIEVSLLSIAGVAYSGAIFFVTTTDTPCTDGGSERVTRITSNKEANRRSLLRLRKLLAPYKKKG